MMGPEAPPTYEPNQMIGREEEPKNPSFFQNMMPLLIGGLADTISTEAVRRSGGKEDNPMLKPLLVKGSAAPALLGSYGLEALLLHALSKKHPGLSALLKGAQTAASGTLAGQNFSLVGKDPSRDDRLKVWQNVK